MSNHGDEPFPKLYSIPGKLEIITNPIDTKYMVPNTPQTSQIFVTGKMDYESIHL